MRGRQCPFECRMPKPRKVAIVQARMGSSRLRVRSCAISMASRCSTVSSSRIQRAVRLDDIVVATTSLMETTRLPRRHRRGAFRLFAAPRRMFSTAATGSEAVGRRAGCPCSADCPLAAPELIDQAIEEILLPAPIRQQRSSA
jgi:spore coat polysaccharide biosynthesis protein SpsF (cytidylyltransferase family)